MPAGPLDRTKIAERFSSFRVTHAYKRSYLLFSPCFEVGIFFSARSRRSQSVERCYASYILRLRIRSLKL